MGRPEPPGHDAEIGAERVTESRLDVSRGIADDDDPRGVKAEQQHGMRQERPVTVVAVASHSSLPVATIATLGRATAVSYSWTLTSLACG